MTTPASIAKQHNPFSPSSELEVRFPGSFSEKNKANKKIIDLWNSIEIKTSNLSYTLPLKKNECIATIETAITAFVYLRQISTDTAPQGQLDLLQKQLDKLIGWLF